MSTDTPAEQTRCEWCGADYDPAVRPPEPPPHARPPRGESAGTEPATHCEWCGAEYPVPGADEG